MDIGFLFLVRYPLLLLLLPPSPPLPPPPSSFPPTNCHQQTAINHHQPTNFHPETATNCQEPTATNKLPPSNCHPETATNQLPATNCHQPIVTNFPLFSIPGSFRRPHHASCCDSPWRRPQTRNLQKIMNEYSSQFCLRCMQSPKDVLRCFTH